MNESSSNPPVRFDELDSVDGRQIGLITLDQAKSLNALSLPVVTQIYQRLQRWRTDARIVAVWLESSSDKAFCAGADLRTLYQAMRAATDDGNRYVADFFAAEYRLDYLIHNYGKPVIAWLHGITMGGGIGLGCGAAHRVVTESSQFAMPEITIGLFPDVAASWFLGRMPGRIGRYLGLTGARLTAADVLAVGLADLPIRQTRKSSVIATLCASRWSDAWDVNHATARRALLDACDWSLAEGSQVARHAVTLTRLCNAATVNECIAAIHAWARHEPWSRPHSKMLADGSPISAVLAWELQERLRHASLAEVFRLEYAAALGCAEADFAEGIRALIIDKDRAPRWKIPAVDAVSNEVIAEVLRARWPGPHPLADLEKDVRS